MRFRTTLATLIAALAIALTIYVTDRSVHAQGRPAPVPIKLYVFDGGTLEYDPARYQLTKKDVKVTQLSVAAHLIVHPKGRLMWDTEAVPDSEWTPTGSPIRQRLVLADGQERFVTITRSLTAQLLAAGYKPEDVTHLALSRTPASSRGRHGLCVRSSTTRCSQTRRRGRAGRKPTPLSRTAG